MPLESSLAISISEPRVGTMVDTDTLSNGFLPPTLMLIFMQTVLLSTLPHFIYAPSISSLRHNVTHSCATITVLCPPFLKSLCPLPLLSQSFPTIFLQFSSLSLYFFFYHICFYVLQHKLKFFHFIDSALQKYRCFLYRQELRKKQILFATQQFKI